MRGGRDGRRNSTPRDYPDDERNDSRGEYDGYEESDAYASAELPDASARGFDERGDIAGRALAPLGDTGERLPAVAGDGTNDPVIIAGSGVPMGDPFIKRRERPLTMRIAVAALMACILVTGLFTITPLGTKANGGLMPFEVLSGALVVHQGESYHWYTSVPGDEFETVAQKFHVQIGGIFELNNLPAGQDMNIGKPYKIPDDPFYGANYQPQQSVFAGATSGSDWWNSFSGQPGAEIPCAPNGGNNPAGYDFHSPNWGSSWVRGFNWYHNGVDIAAPMGNPIHSVQYGEVVWAGWTNTGFGFSVRVNHCNGVATLYGHMSKLLVSVGQRVSPGQVIGLEGMTGWATGPHLHISVVLGQQTFVDPMPYFNNSVYNITHGP